MTRDPRKILSIIGVSVALALLFDFLTYRYVPGLSYALFTGLLLGAVILFTRSFKREFNFEAAAITASFFALSFMTVLRANPTLVAVDIAASAFLFVLLVTHLAQFPLVDLKIIDYPRRFFVTLGNSFKESFRAVDDLIAAKGELALNKTLAQVALGVALTLPVLAVLIILLASADLVFEKYVDDIIDWVLELNAVEHLIVIAAAAFWLIGLFTYAFYRREKDAEKSAVTGIEHGIASSKRSLGIIETSILLGSINILFILFITVQMTYLFGGKRNILGQGFTYAEYAHRGFFELIVVAVLSFVIIRAAELKTERSVPLHAGLFRLFAGTLIGQVMLIMVSAFMRLSIYEAAYGYTRLRIFTQIFIVMLGAMFLVFLYKLVRERGDAWLGIRAFTVALVFLFGVNIANIDGIVGHLNIERWKTTHNSDLLMYALSELSDDAIDEKLAALDLLNARKRDTLQRKLKHRAWQLERQPWPSYNISRARALQKLRAEGLE